MSDNKRKADEVDESTNKKLKPTLFGGLQKAVKQIFNLSPFTGGSSSTNPPSSAPTNILSDQKCVAQTLTVSDQHATLLLTTKEKRTNEEIEEGATEEKDVKSILKLTVVPFHKDILSSNPIMDRSDTLKPELKMLENNPEASSRIVSFLKTYTFNLKSESGAEYSYYNAVSSSSKARAGESGSEVASFDVELVSPASDRQIKRVMPSCSTSLIEETGEMYNVAVKPYIQSIVDSGSLNWILNIIQGKKEQERLLLDHDQFVFNIDTKWRSHPDAFKTPKEEWFQHESIADLYCLAIIKDGGIATLRDLTKEHIPLLKAMKEEGLKTIEKVYGVKSDQIRVFVHYHPQFYHFHMHFTRLHNEVGSQVERGHLISDIVQNLELDSEYYAKRTISYKLKVTSPLYLLIHQKEQENKESEETQVPAPVSQLDN
jgi:m7GpppX diphosphatase